MCGVHKGCTASIDLCVMRTPVVHLYLLAHLFFRINRLHLDGTFELNGVELGNV